MTRTDAEMEEFDRLISKIRVAHAQKMVHSPKAIETRYAGYHFRSRLEARWAVFFQAMGITFEYEKEGYELAGAGRYLPDFWLPQVRMWAEVKPDAFAGQEASKCEGLCRETGFPVLMLSGTPTCRAYEAYEWDSSNINPEIVISTYELISRYLASEHRFYSAGYFDCDREYGVDYTAAVQEALSARFEHGTSPRAGRR